MDTLPHNFSAIIFDVDGTIVDNHSFHEEAWISFLNDIGRPITRDFYRRHINARTNYAIFRDLFQSEHDDETLERYALEKELRYQELYRPHLRARPGFHEFLEMILEAKYPIAAVSNAPRINVDFVLGGLGVRQCFPVILASEDVTHGKPDPALYFLAAERLNISIRDALIFEDSVSGIKAAKASGAKFLVIETKELPGQKEAAQDALAMIQDFTSAGTYLR